MALSPMMQQYFQIKQNYEDTILMFRLGDFYEMFFDDAKTASKELELVLTGRDCGEEERAPMCGVPFHSADGYIARLVAKGYKVAICEQMEDPALAKGIVERDITRIVTPGTTMNADNIGESNNYIMSVNRIADSIGLAVADITTGEFLVTEFAEEEKLWDDLVEQIWAGNVIPVIGDNLVVNETTILKDIIEYLANDKGLEYIPQSFSELYYDKKFQAKRFTSHEYLILLNNSSSS